MLNSQRGSIYRVILGFFIVLAFCFALIWPQYSKHYNAKQLSNAADLGRELAFAEKTYKQNTGDYTAQFGKLDIPLPCPLIAQGGQTQLSCPHYVYTLEQGHLIKAAHKQMPVWLEIDIPAGTIACKYSDDDWAGQDLCSRMQ